MRNDEQAHSIISALLKDLLFIVDLDSMVDCTAYSMRLFQVVQPDTNKISQIPICTILFLDFDKTLLQSNYPYP